MKLSIENIAAHSFKDYHVKGFDYLCLHRSPELTLKVYVFDGVVAEAAEVVMPHDHRYGFDTIVLAGQVTNFKFAAVANGCDSHPHVARYERFAYQTPLNNGSGFSWESTAWLWRHRRQTYGRGRRYRQGYRDLHTIRVAGSETVLMLIQYTDQVPMFEPTRAYRRASLGTEPPALSGLYKRFSEDEIIDHVEKIERLTKVDISSIVQRHQPGEIHP